jgi:asparagine synthase (glutamine-hydrolysing)
MCGIAGILAAAGDAPRVQARVEEMTACLRHRGPDDGGVEGGPGWALGMRRLAIQDLSSAGHQPMRFGDLTLVYNGELYDFHALRATLQGLGYAFHSESDTEVVLVALHHWGMAALERFNGMFALALVDERRRKAWLARDRFGKKPLFYGRLRDGVHFGSELKSLLAVAQPELSLNRESLADYFRLQYVPSPGSIFNEVRKVPPASWVEVDLDTGETQAPVPFWQLPDARTAEPARPEEVLEVVRAAVRRLVVACMRDVEADVRTFSIGFADPRFDESRYAAAVAEHLGTRHTHQQLEWDEVLDLLPAFADSYDEPFADSSALPTMAVSRLARQDVTVALSGDGGDELFGGYLRYRVGPGVRAALHTPRVVAHRLRDLPGHRPRLRRARLFGVLASAPGERELYAELVSIWRSHELAALMPDMARRDGFYPDYERPGAGRVERMMRCDARTYLIDDILQKVDRASMAFSLEARNPLLDPEVVGVAMRSVARAEAAPGGKPLLREALRLRLPVELVERPKMGFGVPLDAWLRGGLRPALEDLVLGRDAAEYDSAAARRVVQDHLSGRRPAAHQVWSLFVLELWRDRWLTQAGTPAAAYCPQESV